MGDISQHIKNWENCLIGKDRSKMTQAQRIERLLEKLKARRFYAHQEVGGWQVSLAMYEGKDKNDKSQFTWLPNKLKTVDSKSEGSGRYQATKKQEWKPIGLDESWGDLFVTAFLKSSYTVPKEFAGKPMYFLFFAGGDGLLRVNGKDRQGADCFHTEMWMADLAKAGKKLDFEVETYQKHEVDVERFHDLMIATMALLDEDAEELYWDMASSFSAAREGFALPEVREKILMHLDEAFKILDLFTDDREEFRKTVLEAKKYVKKNIINWDGHSHPGQIAAMGHSHLDIVYKWEYDEFLRKIERTHTTQLRLMDEFPEFKFSQSQAITYMDMKRLYPDTFKEIQAAVKRGQWEVLGVCYCETDCNIPGGESYIRNVMIGKKFFDQEFGVRPKVAWQCDLFGVQWSLPQILKKAGVDYFVTHKMSVWNSDNPWPYNIYQWEGPDGSKLLNHTPSSHIIQTGEGFQLQSHWNNFGEKNQTNESLYSYGWGDGGSGVMRDMIQRLRRYKDFAGVPKASFEHAEDFFSRLEKKGDLDNLPVWSNELYLETHRGSLTTQGILKKYNRQVEILYRNAEMFSTFAHKLANFSYSRDAFNNGWKEIIKAQFHDGVTGTHTYKAFDDTCRWYQNAFEIGNAEMDKALQALTKKLDTTGEGEALVLFNPHTWETKTPVFLPEEKGITILDPDGNECPSQLVEYEGEKKLCFQPGKLPSIGYSVHRIVKGKQGKVETGSLKVSARTMENDFVRVKLDPNGHVTSFYDKRQKRETIAAGALGNEFQLFEDISGYYEAWDLHNTNEVRRWDAAKASSVKVVEEGPLRAAVEIEKTIGQSVIKQKIVLWHDAHWLDFETNVDWKETHKCLKVAFPLDIVAFNCRYDIAFANHERPTHRSTTWEQTKFEVLGHKWADLSDGAYGLSLINDSKYGYDCEGHNLRLTLLRAPKLPNPNSDIYVHTFRYRLFAHEGDFRQGGTIQNAWEFNSAPLSMAAKASNGGMGKRGSFFEMQNPNIILETVKMAEDTEGAIFRLVDHWGAQSEAEFKAAIEANSTTEINHVEEECSKSKKLPKNGSVKRVIRPYEIASIRLD